MSGAPCNSKCWCKAYSYNTISYSKEAQSTATIQSNKDGSQKYNIE